MGRALCRVLGPFGPGSDRASERTLLASAHRGGEVVTYLIDARTGLEHLTREECLALLAADQIGRLAVVDGTTPLIFPVNYVLDDEAIVFRTDPGTKLDKGPRHRASFEIDGFDRQRRTGWSVLATGRLEEVTQFDSRTFTRVRSLGVEPWAGEKAHWMRLLPDRIGGRRVTGTSPSP